MRATENYLTAQRRGALIRELRSYQPDLDCLCVTDAELIRAVEQARDRHDRERS